MLVPHSGRHILTSKAVESLRNRIKLLANSDRFRIMAPEIFEFDMAMACYAMGQQFQKMLDMTLISTAWIC